MPTRFDKAYYEHFYGSPRTHAQGPVDVARLATVVTSIIEATQGSVKSVLEIGAGIGLWRDWFARNKPRTKYLSTDVSAYACARYGHEQRDIVRWRARRKFDLVVCQSVITYLNDRDAGRAIENLAAMTRGFLYLEAVTSADFAALADDVGTDRTMVHRSGDWYRRRLRPHFRQVGFGLWVRRNADVALWELECGPD